MKSRLRVNIFREDLFAATKHSEGLLDLVDSVYIHVNPKSL